jgi:hypothetical protein
LYDPSRLSQQGDQGACDAAIAVPAVNAVGSSAQLSGACEWHKLEASAPHPHHVAVCCVAQPSTAPMPRLRRAALAPFALALFLAPALVLECAAVRHLRRWAP